MHVTPRHSAPLRATLLFPQALPQTLAAKTTQSQTVLGAQGAGNALYGLRPVGSAVLRALAARMRTSQSARDAQVGGSALFGLRGKDNSTAITAGMLRNETPQRPEPRGASRCAPIANGGLGGFGGAGGAGGFPAPLLGRLRRRAGPLFYCALNQKRCSFSEPQERHGSCAAKGPVRQFNRAFAQRRMPGQSH